MPGKRGALDRQIEPIRQKARTKCSGRHDDDFNCVTRLIFLYGKVKGMGIRFLIDTRAAVSLLHSSVWRQIRELEAWAEPRLVGVDGSALRVLGRAVIKVTVKLSRSVTTDVLIIEI